MSRGVPRRVLAAAKLQPDRPTCNTAQGTIDAFRALAEDCRAGKQIKG